MSLKRAADGRRQRSKEIIDKKRENYRAKDGFLQNTLKDSKDFCDFENHASTPIRKKN